MSGLNDFGFSVSTTQDAYLTCLKCRQWETHVTSTATLGDLVCAATMHLLEQHRPPPEPKGPPKVGIYGGKVWHLTDPATANGFPHTLCGRRADINWRPGPSNRHPKTCTPCVSRSTPAAVGTT